MKYYSKYIDKSSLRRFRAIKVIVASLDNPYAQVRANLGDDLTFMPDCELTPEQFMTIIAFREYLNDTVYVRKDRE